MRDGDTLERLTTRVDQLLDFGDGSGVDKGATLDKDVAGG